MALLEIKNIHKAFSGNMVLKGINLQVDRGDVVSVLGPSGSGKTTLLRCINFLEKPDDGEMFFKGRLCIITVVIVLWRLYFSEDFRKLYREVRS